MIDNSLIFPEYPRAAHYDMQWMVENAMGPNAIWLTEGLTQAMALKPGMRVLDMGCGRAMSSIFLAREFGVKVWANDWWIDATDNWKRICAAGLQDEIFPIHAEAHALPYADGFFDAMVSIDAYHYFGTDDLFLKWHYVRFVKPGGQIGMIVPGLVNEIEDELPDYLVPDWDADFYSFHSPEWWRKHWDRTGVVRVEQADMLAHGWEHWMKWMETCARAGNIHGVNEVDMLRKDAGRLLGMTRVVARRIENVS